MHIHALLNIHSHLTHMNFQELHIITQHPAVLKIQLLLSQQQPSFKAVISEGKLSLRFTVFRVLSICNE